MKSSAFTFTESIFSLNSLKQEHEKNRDTFLHPQYKDVQILKIEVEHVASLYEYTFESFSTQNMNNFKGFVEKLSKKRLNTDVVLRFGTNTVKWPYSDLFFLYQ